MPCSCDLRGMWDRRVSIGQTLNANLGLSTLEPLIELVIGHCIGKRDHDNSNEMVRTIILTTNPLHHVKYTFATLSKDESHRSSYSSGSSSRTGSSALVARTNEWSANKIGQA
ncbi:hypothetical protein Tco_0835249 [Tanacetum coccineum]